MNINELVKTAHENAVSKGFYGSNQQHYCPECKSFINCKEEYKDPSGYCDLFETKNKNIGELLMLVVSELGEALEAHRKSRFADLSHYSIYNDDKMSTPEKLFEQFIKDTFEDELADVVIRIADMCGYLEIEINEDNDFLSLMCAENIGECLLDFIKMICGLDHAIQHESKENQAIAFLDLIRQIEFFCEMNNIDLEKHIELKMKYNATREYKHGKSY